MQAREQKNVSKKKPWPTKAAMIQIYEKNLWGGGKTEFYSGVGSHDPEITTEYIASLVLFLTSFKSPLVICDLGCGDFNVGKALLKYTSHYIAVDIVPELIARNKRLFKDDSLEFHCLDIAKDKLPLADCAIVRQVLQHLSNFEIQQILNQLSTFTYVIITEHIPVGDFIPNKDIISGQGIRLKKQSGVNVLHPPFNFKVKEQKLLSAIHLKESAGIIETKLFKVS